MKKALEFTEGIPYMQGPSHDHEFSDMVATISRDFAVKDVIDFGCGDGRLCKAFSKEGYLGLDIDEKIIINAKNRFSDYVFTTPSDRIYTTEMFMACRVLSELSEEKIHEIMKNVRCKWLLVAESLEQSKVDGNVYSFESRDLENYKRIMRAHDLLLFQHKIKTVGIDGSGDVSFLLFKRCGRNPNL